MIYRVLIINNIGYYNKSIYRGFMTENGVDHRENNLPAREWSNGSKEYFINGKCHRTDGPAWEYPHKNKYVYHLNGVQFENKKEWEKAKSQLLKSQSYESHM